MKISCSSASLKIFPLTFSEYLNFRRDYSQPENIKSEVARFIRYGGFPAIHIHDFSMDEAYTIVRDIYNSTIFRYIKSQSRTLDTETIYSYLEKLEKAFIKITATDLQKTLCTMFAKALGRKTIGADENFFEIDGTSLAASKVAMVAFLKNTLIMAELLAGGIVSVIPNICGVLYGEKDYFAIRRLMKKVLSLSCGLILILTIVFLLFPEKIAIMFDVEKESLLPIAAICLQIYSLSFVFYVFNEFLQIYYQTILETMLATLDTVLEFFALLIKKLQKILPIPEFST